MYVPSQACGAGYADAMLQSYREYRPPPRLEPVVVCLWEHKPARDCAHRIVPDGCVDLIWLAERELVVAGADTGPRTEELPAGTLTSGIRLRPRDSRRASRTRSPCGG